MNFLIRRLSAPRYFMAVCVNIFDTAVFPTPSLGDQVPYPRKHRNVPATGRGCVRSHLNIVQKHVVRVLTTVTAQRHPRHHRRSLLTLLNGCWLSGPFGYSNFMYLHQLLITVDLFRRFTALKDNNKFVSVKQNNILF